MSLVLTSAGEKLEVVATVAIPFTVHYADYVGATPVFTPGVAAGDTINGTKDLLAAPGSGQRVVRTISVHNDSGGADTITIQLDDGGTNYTIVTATVPDDYALYYDEDGWKVLDNNGALATTLFTHALLGPHHSDAATDTPTRGSMITGNATPAWDELVVGGAHQILKVNAGGTDPAWASFDWDDVATGAAADMVHTHGSAAEGGVALGPLSTIQMSDGAVIGAPGDLRIEFDYTNGDLKLYLGDAAGADEVQILDSAAAVVLRIDSNGNVIVVDGAYIGIGAALERIVFDAAGDISVMGADFGIGTAAPAGTLDVAGEIRVTADDAFVADVAQFFTTPAAGLVISGHAGTTLDIQIVEAGGNSLLENPQGTDHVILGKDGGNVGVGNLAAPQGKLTIKQDDHNWGAGLVLEDDGTANDWQMLFDTGGDLIFAYNNASKIYVTSAGVMKLPSLAGVGVRNVVAAADGTLSAP